MNNYNCSNFGSNATRVIFSVAYLFLISSISTPVTAARYELKKGSQYELCRDYVDALNTMNQELPMACGRHFLSEFEKFSKPKWTPLDPKKQPKSFYRQMYLLMSPKFSNATASTSTEPVHRVFSFSRLTPEQLTERNSTGIILVYKSYG